MSLLAYECACAVVNTKSRRKTFDRTLLLSAAAVALIASPVAYANPVGGAVTTGSASIASSSNKANVNQKSEDVVIDWSSFNIGSGQTTQFYQPNAQAIAVNRIGGANASQILGTLDANGRVVLINDNGVLFGKGAQVNVGSLIATSTDGSDSDVLSGQFTQAGKQNARIVNQGQITAASGGVVALVAPNVTNTGTVNAKLGTIALGAANKFTVDFTGDGLVSFTAQGDVNARASAINSGLLSGANVSMTAHAANGIATGIVNMSGIVTAQGVQNVGGTIYLNAGNGTLTTTGTLNAAGATGGGQIETSGHVANISGSITAGKGGLWKVDPENLTIDSTAAGTIDGTLNGGTSVLEQTTSGAATGTGNQTSGEGDINVESSLSWNSTATLTLDSYHSINIAAPITISGAGGLTLITNDNGGAGGDYFFNNGAHVAFTDVVGSATQGSLTINGQSYGLANSISQLASDIANFSGSHFYALANSYDASGDNGGLPYTSTVLGGMFSGAVEGLGNTISNLSIDSSSTSSVGLFTLVAGGTVRDLGLTNVNIIATDPGTSISAGAFASLNAGGTFLNDWATGTISGGSGPHDLFGGLVGDNVATIENSHAAVAVTNSTSGAELGGVAGFNGGTIGGTYATGPITGGSGGTAGGLVGISSGTIAQSYSTGVVIAGTSGGLVGGDTGSAGDIMSSYWDLQTSGIANPSQGAGNVSNDSGITGETTAALQGALPSGFSNVTWSTGAGIYPYLSWQFSSTPQVLSGLAFSDHGVTLVQAGSVYVDANGSSFATLTTGADGYFYDVVAPGTFATNEPLLAYTTGTNNGAHVEAFSGSATNFDIWGNTLIAPTSDTISSLAVATSLQTQDSSLIAQAVGSDSDASFVTGLTNFGYVATGSGFTIDQPLTLSNGLYVKTTGGNITVDNALTLPGSEGLTLDSSGALTIDAPIAITGAGAFTLDYSTSALTNLSFGLTPSGFTGGVNYGSTNNGGTLTINGAAYTLLYSMTDVQNINNALTGNFALATSLDASLVSSWTPLGTDSSGGVLNSNNGFSGAFEGLGNTVSNLTMNRTIEGAGLFGDSAFGSIRDIGLSGISISSSNSYIGGLVGLDGNASTASNGSTIADSYVTGSVSGFGAVGGLVGKDGGGAIDGSYTTAAVNASLGAGGLVGEFLGGAITESYATGAVTGLSQIGGLVGRGDGTISASYATGAVTVIDNGAGNAGGFIGAGGPLYISDSYATGAVNGGAGERIGGFAGDFGSGTITTSYSTGTVGGGTMVGGFVGADYTTGGITNSYWDTDTSGFGASAGAGNISNDSGIAGMHTGGLQGALPGGFSNPTWSTGTGLYPYLSWQFNGTPKAISGKVYSGSTALTGENVGVLIDGSAVAPAITEGSGANGYYYLLLAPGTISGSGSDVVTYLTSGTPANTFVQNVTGTLSSVDLFEHTFLVASHASDSAAILAALPTALGSASGPQFLYTASSGIVPGVNLAIYDNASAFTLDSSIDVGDATLTLYTTGSDTQTAGAITANQLNSTSTGGLSLGDSNAIANLGLVGNSGAGGIAVTDAHALAITGAVSTGSDEIALTTTGGANITITGHLVGGTVDIVSSGSIDEDGSGFIHASTLEGSSQSNVLFNGPNKIAVLGDFTTNSGGGFELYDWTTLDVTGTLRTTNAYYDSTHHSLTLVDETGNLDIDGEVFSGGGKTSLESVHGQVAGTGSIDAQVLAVSADTGIDLDGTNNDILDIVTDTTNSGPNIIDQN